MKIAKTLRLDPDIYALAKATAYAQRMKFNEWIEKAITQASLPIFDMVVDLEDKAKKDGE